MLHHRGIIQLDESVTVTTDINEETRSWMQLPLQSGLRHDGDQTKHLGKFAIDDGGTQIADLIGQGDSAASIR